MRKDYSDLEFQFGMEEGNFERFKNRKKKTDNSARKHNEWLREKRREKQEKRWE